MNNTWLTDNVIIPLVLIAIILAVFPLLVGYIVYVERKVLAFIQSRLGPMRVGPWGLLQPIADALKLLTKEDIAPRTADAAVFKAAPIILLVVGLTALSFLPMGEGFDLFGYHIRLSIVDVNVGVLGLLAISSLSIYSLILGGWASNSKYPLLGALRSAAQMVSYEVALAFTVLATLMIAGTLSLNGIIEAQRQMGLWYVFVQPVGFVLFIIAMVAETNRLPFDLPEAESELVAGYFTEYSGFRWSFFMLGEYAAMTVMSGLLVTLYLGGWMRPFPNVAMLSFLDFIPGFIWFVLKVGFFMYFFIWIRGTYPRYRYDQLMGLGWKVFIPVSIANLFVTGLMILVVQSAAG
ncbi:MAG: NADH-quinone oxidoreductase subunit NuoH [Acidobacteriota bacterium]|jgi:NADH-quinone oxidoreductase subunit H